MNLLQTLHNEVLQSLSAPGAVARARWIELTKGLRDHIVALLPCPNSRRKNELLTLFMNAVNLARSHLLLTDFAHSSEQRRLFVDDPTLFVNNCVAFQTDYDRLGELVLPHLKGTPQLQHQTRCLGAFNVAVLQLFLFYVTMCMDADPVFRAPPPCVRMLQLQRQHMTKLLSRCSSHVLSVLSLLTTRVAQSVRFVHSDVTGVVFAMRYSLDFLMIMLQTFDRLDQLALNPNYVMVVLLDLATALDMVQLLSDFPLLKNLTFSVMNRLLLTHGASLSPTLVVLFNNYSCGASSRAHLVALTEMNVASFAPPPPVLPPAPQSPATSNKRKNSGQLFALRCEADKRQRLQRRQQRLLQQQQQQQSSTS